MGIRGDCHEEGSMTEICEHRSRKMLEKKVLDEEELPCAYAATVTKTTYEMVFECKDCGEKWLKRKRIRNSTDRSLVF